MTYKADWVTGDILTAAQQNALAEQAISKFADATARDAGITSPTEGQFCYLTGTDALQFYDGSSWTATSLTADITGVTAGTNIDVTDPGGPTPTVNLAIDAEVAAADQIISRPVFKDYGETAVTNATSGATETLDLESGNVFDLTLDNNCTITLSNPLPDSRSRVSVLPDVAFVTAVSP